MGLKFVILLTYLGRGGALCKCIKPVIEEYFGTTDQDLGTRYHNEYFIIFHLHFTILISKFKKKNVNIISS